MSKQLQVAFLIAAYFGAGIAFAGILIGAAVIQGDTSAFRYVGF